MGILSGSPQNEPMHYGEVYGAWSFLMAGKGKLAGYQTAINHAGDGDLKELMEEAIHLIKNENQQIEELLKVNGVALPPSPPERPGANLEDIPAGARMLDQEIGAAMSADSAAGLVACSTMIGNSIREDIGMMFGQFHMNRAQLGAKLLKLNKEKGWLVPPPLHLMTPEEN
ncbi:MAG TPA: DUF3231 family protein [Bacillaceae bacterium]